MPHRGPSSPHPRSPAELHLAEWCTSFSGCTRVSDLTTRSHAATVGIIERIRFNPGDSVEAVVSDGTGRLRAVWTRQDSLSGLELGRGLRLEGTVCAEDSTLVMRNPVWCLVQDPYVREDDVTSDD